MIKCATAKKISKKIVFSASGDFFPANYDRLMAYHRIILRILILLISFLDQFSCDLFVILYGYGKSVKSGKNSKLIVNFNDLSHYSLNRYIFSFW